MTVRMNRKLAEKYFKNQASPSETQKVLEWFETHEGERYLKERFEIDGDLMDSNDLRKMVPELDSDKLYKSIQLNIKKKRKVFSLRRTDWLGYTVKAAAAVLVILTASLFTITHQQYLSEQVVESEPVLFQTEDEQHREITLGDGTVVRMNSNSEIVVSPDFMRGTREIILTGEAYFEVEHNPEQPFIIHANQSTVEVLGTAFNVRSFSEENNVQVAVVEGSVLFKEASVENPHDLTAILSNGQYGYLDLSERTIFVDDYAIENYLVWKNGRLVFNNLSLNQICVQLNRLCEITCSFEDDEIKDLQLTANFSNDSIEKTLSVISLSLNIKYEKDENHVTWIYEPENDTE